MNERSPFDDHAEGYDADFSNSLIGGLMREAVWARLDTVFEPGGRVLDLGCGTGEDAIHLAERGHDVHAVDASEPMLERLREKARRAEVDERIEVTRLDIENLDELPRGRYDGVLSNFGALNCVENLSRVAKGLAARTPAGCPVVLCLMGPTVPWEWIWYLAHGQPSKAFRRLQTDGVEWRGIRVRYPTIPEMRRAFRPHFRQTRVAALGALVPPPYTEEKFGQHRSLIESLSRLERNLESLPLLPWLADHYLLELRRR